MKIRDLISVCCVLFLSDGVLSEGENEIKRGHHPFMAYIYYLDETIVDETGARFLRGAVLIKPEWLVSSTVGPVLVNDAPLGFPRKTLLARLGAMSIDANFTLNEDEDEQEREVIQIVRPYNRSATQWWRTDISLLKTLLPFNMSHAVAPASIRTKSATPGGNCYILVFARKFGNSTDDKMLMQLPVELQPPSTIACGQYFDQEKMLCAKDSEENKNIYDPEFCQGNSGSPLVCDNEVTGIQTYIENICKPPHLYQFLSAWDNFITCGVEEKCTEESCSHMCMLINKDDPLTEEMTSPANLTEVSSVSTTVTEEITIPIRTSETTEEDEMTPPGALSTAIDLVITVETTTKMPTPTTTVTTTVSTTEASAVGMGSEETEEPSWPKEKYPERMKGFEEEENKIERKTSVEAQMEDVKKVNARSSNPAEKNMCAFQSLFIFCVLVRLM